MSQLAMFADERPRCRSCGKPIIWTVSATTGKKMPVDAEPKSNGSVELVYPPGGGTPVSRVVPPDERVGLLYLSHFATCPNAAQHRKPAGANPIPDKPAARALRDEAIKQVDEAADPPWKDVAYDAVRRTAELMPEFISDDVWAVGGLDSTREDRALGPVFLRIARDGVAVKTDRIRPSVRSHLSGKPIWRSLIWKEG